jgi:hypothetical protein
MSVQQARRLRKGATDPEKRLWSHLRNRQIGNLKFRRQHPFGNRVVDFFSEEAKLAIDLDGSGHLTGRGQTSDLDREIELLKRHSSSSFLQPRYLQQSRRRFGRNYLHSGSRTIVVAIVTLSILTSQPRAALPSPQSSPRGRGGLKRRGEDSGNIRYE